MQTKVTFGILYGFTRGSFAITIASEVAIHLNEQSRGLVVGWIDLGCALQKLNRASDFPLLKSWTRIKEVCLKGIRIERQCPLEFGVCFIEFTGRGKCDSACGMRFSKVVVKLQCLRRCLKNPLE